METGFTSEASLSGRPHTPPYTPYRSKGKRRLERSDSPASSIHPTETTSPTKKQVKRPATEADSVRVEELAEGDAGYLSDIDVIYPEELEEARSAADSDGDDELSSSDGEGDAHSDAAGIARRISRLQCTDEEGEAEFEKGRRQRRLSRRMGSRMFKRSHSQSVKGEGTRVTDADAVDDQDLSASQRRLRRRVRGPVGEDVVFEDVPRSSPGAGSGRKRVGGGGRGTAPMTPKREMEAERAPFQRCGDDGMDVDEMTRGDCDATRSYPSRSAGLL